MHLTSLQKDFKDIKYSREQTKMPVLVIWGGVVDENEEESAMKSSTSFLSVLQF